MGILSQSKPRLVTTLFLRQVPHGTNGGMSLLGTIASGCGGAFIGMVYVAMRSEVWSTIGLHPAASIVSKDGLLVHGGNIIVYGLICGIVGSLVDSILGATMQATYYNTERKCIVTKQDMSNKMVIVICGMDLLSNEMVNVVSIVITMFISLYMAPLVLLM